MISTDNLVIKNAWQYSCFDYGDTNGTFFSYSPKTQRVGIALSCREEMGRYWKPAPYIGFKSNNLNIKRLNTCFTSIERKLGLTEPTIFYPVVRDHHHSGDRKVDPYTVIVKLNPFWLTSSTHRAFMTLFLRMGAVHYQGNFKDAVYAYGLARAITEPIDWFLAGNTRAKYRNIGYGIVDTFVNNGIDWVKTNLVKPETQAISVAAST